MNAKKVDVEDEPPSIQSNDTTVRVKFTHSGHPELTTPEALAVIFAPFGPTDLEMIVLSLKASKKAPSKPPKYSTALVPFKRIGNAFVAVCGKEPEILGWLKRTEKFSAQPSNPEPHTSTSTSSTFSSFPETLPDAIVLVVFPDIDYESLTLMHMRQAQCERLELEILEREANE
ncbi:hypothetical protein EDD18DRAFT_1408562 [Armillaria luteobubalina]|uniref:Uncharacterized protein n=1 Tax=Armillaria luteobubalina TaxID=153913 RepID=A0AA39PYL4_9AGAR|nr:hypothetical protein EDD18DRAFT_1408562 [Armillaria luteobubalina]